MCVRAVEGRAISAEERALKAEEALQAALEKIHDLERQLSQRTSLENKGRLNKQKITQNALHVGIIQV